MNQYLNMMLLNNFYFQKHSDNIKNESQTPSNCTKIKIKSMQSDNIKKIKLIKVFNIIKYISYNSNKFINI